MGGELAGLQLTPHLGRMCRPNRQCLQSITGSRERSYFVLRLFWVHESDIKEPTAGKAIELKTDLRKAKAPAFKPNAQVFLLVRVASTNHNQIDVASDASTAELSAAE